tara:strand:- start:2815 stop:3294 length:480 start_codon:yes stop_codon:yes gene_type:complete
MTPPHRPLLHARGDTPESDSLQALADHMRANTRVVSVGPRPLSEAFADIWTSVSGQSLGQGLAMMVYELRQIQKSEPVDFAARSRPTPTGMAINAVYTPAALRGRGYASACVTALCREILDSGRSFCTLFADVGNPTANGIYQRIGFQPLGEFVELDFV